MRIPRASNVLVTEAQLQVINVQLFGLDVGGVVAKDAGKQAHAGKKSVDALMVSASFDGNADERNGANRRNRARECGIDDMDTAE
jgi:hypothetical protein